FSVHHITPMQPFKPYNGPCMLALNFILIRKFSFIPGSFVVKGLVELYYKIVLKMLRHAAAVTGTVADNFALGRNDFYIRTFVNSIYNNISAVGTWKSEAKTGGSFGRRNVRGH